MTEPREPTRHHTVAGMLHTPLVLDYDDAYQFVPDAEEMMATWPSLARSYTHDIDFNEVRYSDGLLAAWPSRRTFTQEYRLRDVNPEALALLFGFTWNEVMDRLHPHIERGEN